MLFDTETTATTEDCWDLTAEYAGSAENYIQTPFDQIVDPLIQVFLFFWFYESDCQRRTPCLLNA